MNNIITELKNHILYITINRESKLNALNNETLQELHNVVSTAQTNDEVRIMILTGAGAKAFVAGADISELAHLDLEQGKNVAANGQKSVFDALANSTKPVIAAINGFALGGGLELAMSCHIRVASANAKMGLPEVTLGLIPGYGGTQRLPQLVGKGKAMEMIFTAGMVTAEEAQNIGLVNYTTPDHESLMAKCEELAAKMINNSPSAIAAAIAAVNAGYDNTQNGYAAEIEQFGVCFGTQDFKEGTTAFLEKRKPVFTGK